MPAPAPDDCPPSGRPLPSPPPGKADAPPGATDRPWALLRRLRELTNAGRRGPGGLARAARLVASHMVAEVCSVYLMRDPRTLVLAATQGLRPEAVNGTILAVGEGLVGDIAARAEPLVLTDAQAHPAFAYRPETGEEAYRSFLGVPILRAGRVIGVLAVQNRTMRNYTAEETEALQTVAMVLAEVIAVSGVMAPGGIPDAGAQPAFRHARGTGFAGGIAMGHVILHAPHVQVKTVIAEDAAVELRRLDEAMGALREAIDNMLAAPALPRAGEHRDVMETYRMFAGDRGWRRRMEEAIRSGLTAEAAVEYVRNNMRARLRHGADPYLRNSLHDLDDLGNRLLRHLTGTAQTASHLDLPGDAVVMARNMGAAELLDYDRTRLRGLVLAEGAQNAHIAIVARALRVPLVGRTGELLSWVRTGDPVIVDGDSGDVYLRPGQDLIDPYAEKARFRARTQARYRAARDVPPITRDGVAITLDINAGLLVDLPHLEESGAAGIGLFRTELQFMIASTMPRLGVQTALYRQVMEAAQGKPVVFRTLDVGGDKILPYMTVEKEENPALGWRAVRMALDRPALLRYQVRALLAAAAAAGQDLRLMFPMVAEIYEFRAARALLDRELVRLEKLRHRAPGRVHVGVMLEVPALVWQLDALLPIVDFISVGTNDLLQFFFASDRNNVRVGDRYDPLSPAALRFLQHVAEVCNRHGMAPCLCGEIAGRPLEVMALVGLGFRHLSMEPTAIGPVKAMICSLNCAELEQRVRTLCALPDRSVREHLHVYASDAGIAV